jgi:chitodextrinase
VLPVPDDAGVDGGASAVRRGRGRPEAAVRAGADFSCVGFPEARWFDAGDTKVTVGELLEFAWQAADDPAGHDLTTDRAAAFAAGGPAACPPKKV